jgi:drug/metabolite transporter (DMT)-like permease
VQSCLPVVTAVMAVVWLREKVTRLRLLGIALAITGVLLILTRSQPDTTARSPLVGNGLMLGTVVAWGVYTMLAKRRPVSGVVACR